MNKACLFNFKKDISQTYIPAKINNPFDRSIPDIARIATKEFQAFIASESQKWKHDFFVQKGKMFGVLVVQKSDNTFAYLGTVSGKLPGNASCEKFVPSVFDVSIDDFFINKGMTALTAIGTQIRNTQNPTEILALKEKRRQQSIALQQRLFENYHFLNLSGQEQNLLTIFKQASHGNPPSAAGECAAPKLLQYAIQYQLKPIALAEFWWGSAVAHQGKEHAAFYPACKDKCRPILEYMLEEEGLFERRKAL